MAGAIGETHSRKRISAVSWREREREREREGNARCKIGGADHRAVCESNVVIRFYF